ncbi:MAG: hypothetical protein AABY22_31870 [Nanoarchaeota archaeon]
MNQEEINRYVDNLDVNTQADLLKKVLGITLIIPTAEDTIVFNDAEKDFIKSQVAEFNEQYKR